MPDEEREEEHEHESAYRAMDILDNLKTIAIIIGGMWMMVSSITEQFEGWYLYAGGGLFAIIFGSVWLCIEKIMKGK